MPYTTLHFAPAARGLGDGTTAANAAVLFPSGNWSSLLTNNNYATQGICALVQNTGVYTLSQQGTTTTFSGGGQAPIATTYPLKLVACDASGTPVVPANLGWKCAQGSIDSSNFVDLRYTLTSGNLSVSTQISFSGFKITATCSTAGVLNSFHGLFTWCYFLLSCDTTTGVGITLTTTSGGLINAEIRMNGTAYGRIVTASTSGLISNVRVTADPSIVTGTCYGIAITTSTIPTPINGPVFIKGVSGVAFVNYSTNISAGISGSRMTIADCGTGAACLVSTSGGASKIILSDSVITGCNVGVSHPYGLNELRNVVLRNTSDASPSSQLPFVSPDVEVTTETDSQIYVDSAGGDYRIKATSDHWGKNRGAQDQATTGRPSSPFLSQVIT